MKTFLKGSAQTYIDASTPIDDFVSTFIASRIYNDITRMLWYAAAKATTSCMRDATYEYAHAPVWDSVNDSIFMSVHRYMKNYDT